MAHHGIGVALGLLVLLGGQGGLGDEGPQTGVVGRVGQVGQLILGDGELLTELAQARGDLRQAALDEGSGHPGQSTLPPVRLPSTFRLAVLAALLVATTACSGGSDAACGPIRREALDSAYLVHVLDDTDTSIEYTSNPPTSGPHKPGPELGATVTDPISKPVQVGLLEQGDVLLQYLPSLPKAQRTALAALGGERVTVAPNPDLDDPIVATAWLFKRSCRSFDADALREFVDQRAGHGPEGN